MSGPLASAAVACPYCGETIELLLDGSAGSQRYIEDCHVCCQPIEVTVTTGDGGDGDGDPQVTVATGDDA